MADFDAQVTWLKQRGPILPLPEVVDRLREGRAIPKGAVVLTFDDGLRNNVTDAYPVLLKHQVPATFFVCPGLIETGEWIWTYEVRDRLKGLTAKQLAAVATQCSGNVDSSNEQLLAWMKGQPNEVRLQTLETVRAATPDFQVTDVLRQRADLASWEELGRLDERLVTVGSHSMTHPILTSLKDEDIETELAESKRELQDRGFIKHGAGLLCYPDGRNDARVRACAQKHYDAACGTVKGLATPSDPLFAIPRIGANSPLEDVAWRLWRPGA